VYEYLEGTVAARSAARVVIDVGGVGYDLLVPLRAALPHSGPLRVWTHLAVREDAHTLYGFPDRDTRDLFRTLLKVRGVGPSMALGILSGLDRSELIDAIRDEDLRRLTKVKGVGKKTAEQILLDLRDHVTLFGAESQDAGVIPRPVNTHEVNIQDAAAALASVGYSEKDARKQVEKAAESVDASDLELLVRTALQG